MTVIRLAGERDAPAIVSIYAPFCTENAVSFEEVPPPPEEMAGRIRSTTERLPWLVLEDGGGVAGYVYARPFRDRAAYRWSVEVTVYVDPAFRRRGVARALYTTLFRLLDLMGFSKVLAGITLPNPASVGLHLALGFTEVGVYRGVGYKLGAWHDVGFYQMMLRPELPVPAPTRSVHDVMDSPDWAQAIEAGLALYR